MRSKQLSPVLIVVGLSLAEGLLAFVGLLAQPSEAGSALLLGYSPARLALAGVILILLGLLSWAGWSLRRAGSARAESDPIESPNGAARRLPDISPEIVLWLAMACSLIFLIAASFLAVYSTPFFTRLQEAWQENPALLSILNGGRAVFGRAWPFITWFALLSIQTLALMGIYRPAPLARSLKEGQGSRILLALLIGAAVLFHWSVLVLQLKVFVLIPYWKWYFTSKEVPFQSGLAAAMMALTALGVWTAGRFKRSGWVPAMLIALGCFLQVSFGFLGGQGFETLRLRYADSVFNGYAFAAAEQPDVWQALTTYEQSYGSDHYLGTKPPGALLPYIALEKLVQAVHPLPTVQQRFEQMTVVMAYAFPLLAFLVLLPLAALARRLLPDPETAWLALIFYITCPSVLLIPLFLDQVLYPLLFTLFLLWITAGRRQGLSMFLAGAAIYAAIYFSFSLLPLLPFALVWIAIDGWLQRETRSLRRSLGMGALLLGGFLAMMLVMRIGLNYDFLARYQNAFAEHRTTHEFSSMIERVRVALVLNNAEFISFAGFPLSILAAAQFISSIWAFARRTATRLDGLALTLALIYLLVNVFGQTVGEVQRLFLFLIPLVAILAARPAAALTHKKPLGLIILALLQLGTAILLFWFQDYYG